MSSLRNIFPLGFLGIASTNSTPPLSRLRGATFLWTNSAISAVVTLPRGTTKALGNWPAYSSGMPTTAASATNSCDSSTASSSAGATWKVYGQNQISNAAEGNRVEAKWREMWLMDWWSDLFIGPLIDWLIDWWTYCLMDQLTAWSVDRFFGWLIDCWHHYFIDQLTDCSIDL